MIILSYHHFTLEERKYLQELIEQGYSIRKISSFLGRWPSSVSREIKRNKAQNKPHRKTNKYWYNSWRAQILTMLRRRVPRETAIPKDSPLYFYIIEKLNSYWSPEQISARWRIDNPNDSICFSTIYRYIKRKAFPDITAKTNLRRRGKNYHYVHRSSCNVIHPDRIIPDWPDEIVFRTRIGDWEGDTVYGGIGKGAIVTLVDRKSRFLCAGLLSDRDSIKTREAIHNALKGLPVKSLSLDNGSEFADFRNLEKDIQAPIYFAEPHKPWQRGTNENTNDILRFFFPKGFDFRTIDEDVVQAVVNCINNRPRKCLGWKSPAEVFYSVALT